jgi:hypothetical protein
VLRIFVALAYANHYTFLAHSCVKSEAYAARQHRIVRE